MPGLFSCLFAPAAVEDNLSKQKSGEIRQHAQMGAKPFDTAVSWDHNVHTLWGLGYRYHGR